MFQEYKSRQKNCPLVFGKDLKNKNAEPTTLVRPQSAEAVDPDIGSAFNYTIRASSEDVKSRTSGLGSVEVAGDVIPTYKPKQKAAPSF